ncbi:MAG: acyltransferase domain-containing protein, partial [Bacteroidota bacterium]
ADACFELLREGDLRGVLYPDGPAMGMEQRLHRTEFAQPLLFIVEYALARMWNVWGVEMAAAIGHSIGEYVAATLAGVLSLEDALALVTIRAKLMQGMEAGAMLAVALPESELRDLTDLAIAAVNEPASCVVSGAIDAVASFRLLLQEREVASRYLNTSHAFHSAMMEPMLAPFADQVARVRLMPPRTPYISNVTGTWITAAQATDPDYWVQHVRRTVRFADGLRTMMSSTDHLLLEVGPGRMLSRFATRIRERSTATIALSTIPDPAGQQPEGEHLLNTVGQLWLAGVDVDWRAFSRHRDVRRVHLPTYPFERRRYWIDPLPPTEGERGGGSASSPTASSSATTAGTIRATMVNAAHACAHGELDGFDVEPYQAACASLDALCAGYMNRALRQLGAFKRPDDRHAPADLLRVLGVVPRFYQLVGGWLEVLVGRGDLRRDERGLLWDLRPISNESVAALAMDARRRWADTPQVAELVETCGEFLVDVVRGDREPLELFMSTIDPETERSRHSLLPNLHYTSILRTAIADAVRMLPSSVRLRILEVGGGTGIATREILPVLPPDRTSYTFTDVGKWFLTRARERFGAYPFISCEVLDLNESPIEQGYAEEGFDIIIAVNMLHATRNIPESLARLRPHLRLADESRGGPRAEPGQSLPFGRAMAADARCVRLRECDVSSRR